jgi:hypothetical protein
MTVVCKLKEVKLNMKKFKITYFKVPLNQDGTLENAIIFEEDEVEAVDIRTALDVAGDTLGSVVGIIELGYE